MKSIPIIVAAASVAFARPVANTTKCPVILDGRVPSGTALSVFDTSSSLFNPDYVKGEGLAWSDILLEPDTTGSEFDSPSYIPIEVTISDESIFQTQNGFRRAGLQFSGDSSSDSSDTGIKTIHWSVKQDLQRPMNLSHEYLNVWHETSDYSANQFNFQAGQLLNGGSAADKDTFKLLGRSNNEIWSTAIDYDEWQNFALTLDYTANTIQLYYSLGQDSLEAVTDAVQNDNSGQGQFQIGILKKPTGTSDVVNSGFQETGIDEGQIYGGLFVEDSADGCISL